MLNRMYCVLPDGRKIAMPRYYKNKIYRDDERSEIAGYQKGEMEKRFLKNAESISARDRNQSIERAFDRYYKNAAQGRNKI